MNKLLPPLFVAFALLFSTCKKEPVGGNLEDTYWQLATLKVGNRIISPPENANVTLSFATEELKGTGVCNRYFADIEAEGTSLFLSGVGSTKMACEGLDFENLYFQVLAKAHSYSALADKLIVFSEEGEIAYSPMSETQAQTERMANGVGKLIEQFPPVEGDIMPHLYPIVRVDKPGKYPFKGTLIDPSLYQYFDEQSSEIWNSTGGDVLAVGKYGGFYICRVPGRYVSSDIAIFQLKNGKLRRSETVAWAWCDEGWCNQQDAWLKDVNMDDRMDLIQRYTLTDDTGKVREERVHVMLQSEDGTFKEDKSLQLDRSQFRMAKI